MSSKACFAGDPSIGIVNRWACCLSFARLGFFLISVFIIRCIVDGALALTKRGEDVFIASVYLWFGYLCCRRGLACI